MKCPNCHREMPDYAAYCSECGHPLRQPTCPRCGGQVSAGDRYCGMCGADLSLPNSELQQTKTQPAEMRPEPVRTTEEAVQTLTKSEHTAEPAQTANKPGRKKNEKTRKRWKPVLILVVCLFLAAGDGFTAWWFLGSSNAQLLEATVNYEEVNEALLAVTTADAYNDLTTEEKAEQLLEALTELADEGKVLADSVGYDESYPLVYYSYADGAYGGVMLEEFAEGTSGVGEGSYSARYEDGNFVGLASIPPFGMSTSPYEQEDLTALIVCDFGDDEGFEGTRTVMAAERDSWSEMYIDTTLVEEGTVSFYRNGLLGYNLAVIQEHGFLYKHEPTVVLQESVNILQFSKYRTGYTLTSEERALFNDIQKNRVAMVYGSNDRQWHFLLMPAFFSYYYADDGLEDTIVWIGCCDGYYNDALVSAFAACGAKAVLAPTETIETQYGFLMLDAFVYMLMCGNTVEESLTFAQSQWGANDKEFVETILGTTDTDPAEIRIYNGGDETLVTLTAEGQDALKGIYSGTVVDAADSSVPIAGAAITVTDADGTVAETTTDETGAFEIKLYLGTYTVQIEMEGYQSVSSEVTVVAGESTDILISLPAEISDADARAAYWAFLYDEGYADDITDEDGNSYDVYMNDFQYAMYDLNGDGISELLLHGYIYGISATYYIYGYDGDVFLIGSCDNFNREGTYYSVDENALVIVSSGGADWITYEFYEVSDQLTLTYTVYHQFFAPGLGTVTEDNPDGYEIWSFYITEAGSEQRAVTEEEWNSYIDNLTEIELLELTPS